MENKPDTTEFNKMKNGGWYDVADPEIVRVMNEASQLTFKFNYGDKEMDQETIKEKLFGAADKTNVVFPLLRMSMGINTFLGERVVINHDCDFNDRAQIVIGSRTRIEPRCQFITDYQPLHAASRGLGKMRTKPITIGADCWIGAGATIMGGVNLGNKTIVAAGAVVTKPFPDGSVVLGGNPATVIRKTDNAHSDIPEAEFEARNIVVKVKQELQIGEQAQIAAMTLPPNTRGGNYSFRSETPAVATVTRAGVIEALQPGEATILVQFMQPNFGQVISERVLIKVE